MVNLRCCEIHELKNDKIVECHILIDVIDLIFQTGVYPINKSRGSEGNWLSPINTDGVNFFEQDFFVSPNSKEVCRAKGKQVAFYFLAFYTYSYHVIRIHYHLHSNR